jgi:hypothetical protein
MWCRGLLLISWNRSSRHFVLLQDNSSSHLRWIKKTPASFYIGQPPQPATTWNTDTAISLWTNFNDTGVVYFLLCPFPLDKKSCDMCVFHVVCLFHFFIPSFTCFTPFETFLRLGFFFGCKIIGNVEKVSHFFRLLIFSIKCVLW